MLCIAIKYRTAHCRREVFLPCSLERLLPPKEKAFPTMPFDEAEEERGTSIPSSCEAVEGKAKRTTKRAAFPLLNRINSYRLPAHIPYFPWRMVLTFPKLL